ncbi:LamB/YcsF family protein [Alteribacillus iranensis]|uniref:5-oxoprolinase subunit A n=1 Tax=Alteribacillus iranensis TaxID=930128 RepID=A0A1I2ED27_9BACI|nr:5-oxoprolinase subunit PxpA [Alteribacillus iranensis]SFE90567.1 UPF0271 protein [Alteribacillus iranensis]
MVANIDLNCDLGESYGDFKVGEDDKILPYITSANIACGYHAGDHNIMARTVQLAKKHNTSIGAHPSFPDLGGFGRREMKIAPEEIYRLVIYQIGALHAFARTEHIVLQHVKPHGALYNMAAKDYSVAEAIAEAVYHVDPNLVLFGLSGSELVRAGENRGLHTAHEVFADRTYQPDGSLTPRTADNAFIETPEEAAERILQLIEKKEVAAVDGTSLSLQADTVCVHGDNPKALNFVRQLHHLLMSKGVQVKALRCVTDGN